MVRHCASRIKSGGQKRTNLPVDRSREKACEEAPYLCAHAHNGLHSARPGDRMTHVLAELIHPNRTHPTLIREAVLR